MKMETEVDDRFEFDAPRYCDFGSGSPDGVALDMWFNDAAATKRLATPEEVINRTRNDIRQNDNTENREEFQWQDPLENMGKSFSDAANRLPPLQGSVSGATKDEAAHVRAVLAHITNKTVASGKSSTVSKGKAATTAETNARQARVQPPAPAAAKQQSKDLILQQAKKGSSTVTAEENTSSQNAKDVSKPVTRSTSKPAATASRGELPSCPMQCSEPAIQQAQPIRRPDLQHQQQKRPTSKPPQQQEQRRGRAPPRSKLTVPHSPLLRSKHRSALQRHQVKSSEELELEEVERAKRQAAELRRKNQRTLATNKTGGATSSRRQHASNAPAAATAPPRSAATAARTATQPPKRRQLTAPKSPLLRTAKRQRVHDMRTRSMEPSHFATKPAAAVGLPPLRGVAGGSFTMGKTTTTNKAVPGNPRRTGAGRAPPRPKLTLPRTPRFATTSRARAPRFKPTEEEEAERAAQARAKLRARPLPRAKPAVAPPARQENNAGPRSLTAPQPFSFATDARAAVRARSTATHVDHLPPFVFGAGLPPKGPVTRSRARVSVTAAPALRQTRQRTRTPPQQDVDRGDQQQQPDRQRQKDGEEAPGGGAGAAAALGQDGGRLEEDGVQASQRPSAGFLLGKRRRTTAGPLLLGGGARRVLQSQPSDEVEGQATEDGTIADRASYGSDDSCDAIPRMDVVDGMQDALRHGATLHNPLFRA